MSVLGKKYGKDAKEIARQISDQEYKGKVVVTLRGKDIELDKEDYDIVEKEEKIAGEWYVPHVIEPSYGIDRILYTVLEHSYTKIGERKVLRLKPWIAPISVGVFPLMAKDGLDNMALDINRTLRNEGIMTYYDDSGSIGRRYARMDEIGTPFCVTVDYDSLSEKDVTIRERDSTKQVRVSIDELVPLLKDMISGRIKFDDVYAGKK